MYQDTETKLNKLKMAHTKNNTIPCYKALDLLDLHLGNDPSLTDQDRATFQFHIEHCHKCADEYEEAKWVLGLVKKYARPEDFRRAINPKKEASDTSKSKLDPLDKQKRSSKWLNRKRNKTSKWAGTAALAACVILSVCLTWNVFTGRKDGPSEDIPKISTSIPNNDFEPIAELITPQGKTPLQFNQQIKAGDLPQEILLGGMHRVVMNSNTVATFTAEPVYIETEHRVRHAIQLSKGEIYVEVVPGHPFSVRTHNALLKITGTKFNVTADTNETKLTLLKGSVRFSNLSDTDEFVDVTAGYSSLTQGRSFPETPIHTNALTATAWARDFIMGNALAQVQPCLDEEFLESIRDSWIQTTPPNLDKIDYQQWREEHRDWFKKQFPWIFDIQKVLKDEHNIEADYIDLLMISGDIWQFNYPRPSGKPIPICTSNSIERLNKHYDVKLEKFPSLADTNLPSIKPSEVYQNSLANWHTAIINAGQNTKGDISDELLLFNMRAGQYLTNTRIAAYLWVKENPGEAEGLISAQNYCELFLMDELTDSVVAGEVLQTYLAEQVSEVSVISNGSQELFTTPKSSGCEDNVAKLVRELQKGLSEFMHGGEK